MATITAPSGREYQWNKDTPPTEDDIAYIKQKDAELNTPTQSQEAEQSPLDVYTSMSREMTPIQQGQKGYAEGEITASEPPSAISQFVDKFNRLPGVEAAFGSARGSDVQQSGYVPSVTPENAVRYGLPIAAMAATAPASVPVGLSATLGQMALTSGVGGISSALGELGAQKIAGEEADLRKIGSSSISGATPFIPSGIMNRPVSALSNMALAQGAMEAAKYVEKGKLEAPKSILEFAPAALSGSISLLGGSAGTRLKTFAKKEALANERFGGSVILSELFPQYTDLEAKQIASKNPLIMRDLQNMEVGIGETIAKHYADVPNAGQIANKLAPYVGELDRLQLAANKAASEASSLSEAARAAETTGRADARALREQANAAVITEMSQKAAYNGMLTNAFGKGVPSLEGVALGRRMEDLAKSGLAAKASSDEIISQAYKAANVTDNTQVVSLKDVIEESRTIRSNDERKKFVANMTAKFGDKPTMSLSSFRQLKDSIAADLVTQGFERSSASRLAGQQYDVVKRASENFMDAVHPARSPLFKQANQTARTMFEATSNPVGAIDKVMAGDANGLYSLIKDQGEGPVTKELNHYAASLDAIGGKQAGDLFRANVSSAIRDGLLDSAANSGFGHISASRTFDPSKIFKEADSLASKGFPIESLGFGTRKDISELAKLSSVGQIGGIRPDEVSTILQLVDTHGGSGVAARIQYARELERKFADVGYRNSQYAITKSIELAKKGRITSDDANAMLAAAQNSPIARLLNGTAIGIKKDPAANAGWASTVLSLDPLTLKSFKTAMVDSGQASMLSQLGLASEASIMSKFQQASQKGTPKIDGDKIVDFFVGPANSVERNNLESLIGKDEFKALSDKFLNPLDRIAKAQMALSNSKQIDINGLQAAIGARAFLEGKASAGVIQGNLFKKIYDYAKSGQYSLLHSLYIDPVTSKKFASNLYDINKFVNSNPVNAVIVRLAMDKDAQAKAESE